MTFAWADEVTNDDCATVKLPVPNMPDDTWLILPATTSSGVNGVNIIYY